jgi:hypothetical protein
VLLCYAWGGVAKLNPDWLGRNEPMRTWMPPKATPFHPLARAALAALGRPAEPAAVAAALGWGFSWAGAASRGR